MSFFGKIGGFLKDAAPYALAGMAGPIGIAGLAASRAAGSINAGSTDPYRTNPYAFLPPPGQDYLRNLADNIYDQRGNAQQNSLAAMLQRRASGQESTAREMLKQSGEDAAARAYANAHSGGAASYNPGMAFMLAEQQAADARSQAARQGSIAALQEQQQAQDTYGGLLGQMRGQTMQERLGQFNALNQLSEADRNALIAQQQLESENYRSAQGIGSQNAASLRQLYGQIAGGAAGGAGGFLAHLSDERLKTDITDESEELDDFLGSIKPNGYRYKNKAHGDQWYVSPMAQELEKSKIGRSMVVDTPDGKAVDYGRGLGAMLASQARLAKRLDKLEGARR